MTDRIPPLPRTNAERNAERAARQAEIVSRARLATPVTAHSGKDTLDITGSDIGRVRDIL